MTYLLIATLAAIVLWLAIDVLMQYGQPVPLALAVKRVGNGRTVFVAREDAGAVLEVMVPTIWPSAALRR
jgi:hypothetical protein